jgi:hypothetical protein
MEHALAAGFEGIEYFTGLTSEGPPPNVPAFMAGGAVIPMSESPDISEQKFDRMDDHR